MPWLVWTKQAVSPNVTAAAALPIIEPPASKEARAVGKVERQNWAFCEG